MKIQELNLVNSKINQMKSDTLTVDAIKMLLKLSREVETKTKDFQEVQKKILDGYGIKPTDEGLLTWEGHKKRNEISEKINELRNTDYKLENKNFMKESEFLESAKGMKIHEIFFLQDILVKE